MPEQDVGRNDGAGTRSGQDSTERWLSVYEAAARVLQHPDTVRRWIADGLIVGEQRGRLGWRIPQREVDRYLTTNFMSTNRNPANHALSSNVVNPLPTSNQPRERDIAGAGWPFNRRVDDEGAPLNEGKG